MNQAAHDRRQRRVLVGVALLFFAPLGLAFYLYYGHGTWHPGGSVNAGDLVNPARPLPALALPLWTADGVSAPAGASTAENTDPNFLKGRWTFLHVGTGRCDEACQGRLYDTRQIRIRLDRDMKRVQRVYIADAGCCDARFLHDQHPDLIAIRASPEAAPLLALLPTRDGAAEPRLYLVDPLGNLMMSYPAGVKAKGILEDIQRLLRLSSIG